jgi:hypothetical protein
MAETVDPKKFSSASYIDIPAENYYTTADDPNKLGFTQRGGLYKDGKGFTGYAPVISEGKFSGKQKLYINGIAAQGLINDKFYLGGDEQTKEQIEKLPVQTILPVAGELAALGLRAPTGRGGVEGTEAFVRDAAAETKFYADFRKVMARTSKQAKPAPANAATTGGFGGPGGIAGFVKGSKEYYDYWANASDEAIFRLTGGVNKEGRPASAFGINDVLPPGESKYVDAEYTVVKQGGGGGGTPFGSVFGAGGTGDTEYTGQTYQAPDGRIFNNLTSYNAYIAQTAAEEKRRTGQSAYDLLFLEFDRYGMGSLVEGVKDFIVEGLSKDEFTLRLRQTDAYQKRFAANQARIKNGLRALSEAEYLLEEDKYQDVMRRYGLPESYYTRGDMGRQEGFEKLIAGDVSPVELEDRIQTAQNRVVKANPEVSRALREFYPEITGGDILAYALDPAKAIENIKRKVTSAEIGAGAMQAGLTTGVARAEELQRYGVTKETAQQGFGTIASGLERGRQLSNIYQQPTYTQEVAETEVFALPDAEKSRRQRRKLGQLETATFSGSTGMTGGALDRERAGQY